MAKPNLMHPETNTPHPANKPRLAGWGTYAAANFGTLWLGWSSQGLLSVDFRAPETPYEIDPSTPPAPYREPLDRYFAGEQVDFKSVSLQLVGTPFQLRVWNALQDIPYGSVCSYAHIASAVDSPRAMRAVGAANGANPIPIIVPCHRVVEVGHKLGGYSGGLERKRRLLELEGAHIVGDLVQPGQLGLF